MSERLAAHDSGSDFRMDVETAKGGIPVVVVAGDVDLYSAPRLRDQLAALDDDGVGHVVLDLADVTLLDSMALGVLLGAKRRLGARGGAFEIVVSKPDIRRIFEITMLDRVLPLHASRGDALQADGGIASADSVD
jgi:anti-sigma B factor antagonist